MSDKVDRLAREEEALAAKLKSLRDERIREEKKRDSRRAEVVGGLVLKRVAEGELEASWLGSLLREGLTRKTDRALFELEQEAEDESVLEPPFTDDVDLEDTAPGEDDEDDLETLGDVDAERSPAITER